MFNNRFLRNISANTVQIILNQIFGLAIFYALSKGIDKVEFGKINWSLAVLLTFFGILTFGIDQVMVKKIAAGYNRNAIFSAYLYHVLISGIGFYVLLVVAYLLFPAYLSQRSYLLFIGIGKLAIFFSNPFKQLVTALEKFRVLAVMSTISNLIRGTALILLLIFHNISVTAILIIFITGDLIEFLFSILLTKPFLKKPFQLKWNRKKQILLLKESFPQTGVVLFTAIMSRFDWIMVGLLISSSKLAEYSFAYKIFEVSTLPLLVIAPIMIPMFTRLQKMPRHLEELNFFLEWQIILACGVALVLNLSWVPVIDFISDGRYGSVNRQTIFLLSLSMPLLYATNYLWTVHFTRGNLKMIFFIMAISFTVNILGCCLLIPVYHNEGAALAYVTTAVVQFVLYGLYKPDMIKKRLGFLIAWPLFTLVCGFFSSYFAYKPALSIGIALFLFFLAVFISKKVRRGDLKYLLALYQ